MKVRLSILAAFVTILSFGCCQAQSTNVLNMKNETIYGHEIEMYTVEQGEKRDKRQ